MIIQGQLLSASNLNNAYISKTSTNAQSINSTLTISGGALTLKNSIITDNANSSYMRIDPQGNNVIIYDGVNNQRLDVYSSSGTESTYLTTVNGSKSVGQIDVSSAIDHLEINTNSRKTVLFGGNVESSGGIIQSDNPSNNQANVTLSWINNDPRLRIGGAGSGASGTFRVQGIGDSDRFTVDSAGNTWNGGTAYTSGKLTASGGVGISGSNSLSFDTYGGGFNMQDTTWIRTTGNKSLYLNTGTLRTDGTLQVGNGGATLSVTSGGSFNYNSGALFANTSNQVGIGTTSPRNRLDVQGGAVIIGTNIQNSGGFVDGTLTVGNTNYSYSGNNNGEAWGSNGDTITLQAKDYSTIAFLQANTKVDYIRGGAGSIDIGYDGGWGRSNINFTNGIWNNAGNVGIGTTSPARALDVNGSIRTNGSIYSPSSYLGFLTDAGGALPIKVGSLAIASAYAQVTAPSNGLYVQGNVGINNPTPAYNLDISGNMNVTGIIYSLGNNQANFQVGNDSQLWDINVPNTMGIYGVQNSAVGALKLGSTGPTLYGSGNFLGIGTTNPAYTLDVSGNIRISAGNNINSSYNNNYFLADHADGDISLSAVGRNLILGIQNTSQIAINAPLYGSNNTTQIIGTDGTLYYKGTDIDTTYFKTNGSVSMSGDLNLNANRLVFNNGGASNLDHIWFNDNASPYGDGGSYSFVADSTGNAIGNATLYAGSLALSNQLDMQNHNIKNISYLYGQYGTIAQSTDEWLRFNNDGSHTSGVYFGSSIVRTDGQLQIGNNGASFLVDTNGNLTANNGTYNGYLSAKGFQTSNTSSGNANNWTKIGSITLTSQYSDAETYTSVMGISDGSYSSRFRFWWRVKQQSALGQAPIVELNIYDEYQVSNSNLIAVTTINTSSQTTVELYAKIPNSYEAYLVNPYQASGSITWYTGQGFLTSLPSGTQTTASYHVGTMHTSRNTLDDGSGNMTISGKFTAGGVGFGNVTSGYYGDSNNLAPRIPSSSGYFAVQNSSLVNQLQVYGTGRVLTAKNTLDDSSGNATLAGTITLGADPSSSMQGTTKQYVDRKVSFVPMNAWYAKNPIDDYPNSMFSAMKFNSALSGQDWGSGSDGMSAGLVVTHSSRDSSTDNNSGTLYPGSVHQMLYHESGYGIYHRYANVSRGYSNISVWSPSISPALNSLYMPTQANENGYYYKVTTTGNASNTEPLWGTTVGGTTNDGTMVWTNQGTIWAGFDKVLTAKTINATDVSTAVGQGLTTTSNPTFSGLNVSGNITGSATFISNSTSSDIFQALGASGTKTFRWEGGNLRFWSSQSSVGEALTLASNGNIGIHNTTNPAYQLDVSGDIRTTTAFRATANNTQSLYVGSNSAIWDVNTSNTMGIYGQQNTAVGAVKLGSTGPTLYGTGNMLGIGTTSPAYTLDVNGNIAIGSGNAIYDKYNNQPIIKDYGNGNIVVNGAGGYLYLGYQNTTKNIVSAPLYANDLNTEIVAVDGTLYYKGQDVDSRYVNVTGDTMTGSLTITATGNGAVLQTYNTERAWSVIQSGTGASSALAFKSSSGGKSFQVQNSIGNVVLDVYTNSSTNDGIVTVNGTLSMNNNTISGVSVINGQYGRIANSRSDEWLGLNDDGSHTSGVYFGSSIVRTDGTLQVGQSGATLNIPQNGTLNWQNGNLTLTSGGTLTAKGQIISNTTYGQGQGFKLDTVTIDTAISTGNVAIGGLNQLRFGTSTSFDWNQWAGIKYDSNSNYLYIGGPASQFFNSNSTPPTINVAFTGVGKVGIGKDTPSKTLDVAGDIELDGDIYANSSWLGIYNVSGGSTTVRTGGLSLGSNYSIAPPSNGLYVQGGVGIGTASPTSMFQVNESGMQMYTTNDHVYLQKVGGTQYPYLGFLDSGGTRGGYIGWGAIGSHLDIALENNNNLYINFTNGTNKVGIGTATPSQPLDVAGNVQTSSTFISNGNGDIFQALGTGTGVKTFRYDHSNLRFWTNSLEVMTLGSGGNVGINNANPSYILDVGGDIKTSTAFRAPTNNTQALYVGTNSAIWDVNTANTMGIYGQSNTSVGGLKLGSTGPTLYGSGGTLGIGTTAPWTSMALDVAGSIRISAGHGIYSGYNNSYILNDHNNGNVTLNATSSASGNLYLGYNNTAHVYLATNLTMTNNTNIIGTDGTLYYKGQDTDARYLNATGDNMSGNIIFAGNSNYGIYSDPSNWTRIDPNGQRFIMPVPSSRVTNGDLILSVEDTGNSWKQVFKLTASGDLTAKSLSVTGNLWMNNTPINSVSKITGQYGTIANSRADEWLGLNDDGTHTAGVYFGSSITRTDGTLQVGSSGSYFNANSSGITLTAIPIVNRSGNGTELLRFNTDSGWSFYQSGSGSSANLALKSAVANKDFIVQNVSGNAVLDVFTGSGNTDGVVTVNGDSQVNSGKQGMTGYVKVVQAVPDLTNHTNITTSGWYNIAHNPNGDRAFGKFTLLDVSIARHQVVQFTAASAYASGIVSTVHLLGQVRAAGTPFTSIRIVYNSSAGGEYWLQSWIDISDNTSQPAVVRCILEDNYWESGWQLINFTAGTVPSGYTTNSFQISDHDHMPNLYSNTSTPPSQGAGIGDIYVQY